jgi:hypothetical protein
VPGVQGSIVASLDAASGTLTKAGFLPFGESASHRRSVGLTEDAETKTCWLRRVAENQK